MLYVILLVVFGAMWLHYEITDPDGRWYRYFH